MKQFLRLLFIVLSLSASFTSCHQEAPTELLLTTNELTFANEGGGQIISFAANKNWTASSSASWIKLSATSGDSSVKSISVTANVNSDYDDRTCVITITADEISKTINVTQSSNIGLIVSPNSFNLDYNENVISVNVRHNVDFSVIIPDSSRKWIQMSTTNATKSLVDDAISLRISQNTTREIRESSITIKQVDGPLSETVLLRQAHYDGLETNPQSFSIDKEEQIIEVCVISSMDYDVYYNSGVVCDWITLFDKRKVDDLESTLSFKINENTDASTRRESIYFLSKGGELKSQVSISQGPTYYIDIFSGQSDYVLSCYDQVLSFSLQTNADPLEYSSDKNWIHFISEETGVYYIPHFKIDKNDSPTERDAIITIKQQDGNAQLLINVKQQGVRSVPEGAVDLGLSVFWASCNVGASSSEDYGGYYAWGELSEKDFYSWETYKWGEKTSPYSLDYLMTKYNSTDKLRSLQSEDDVANMVMGEKWRIPTKQECEELWKGCIWTEVEKNGILGYEGKSRINGETIFIPFAGIKVKDNINSIGTEFGIWTSERYDENRASFLTNSLGIGIYARDRYVGFPIRAVYE